MPRIRRSKEQIVKDLQQNFEELKQQIKKKYPDIIYTHISSELIKKLTDRSNIQSKGDQPYALYFSKDYQYFKDVTIDRKFAGYHKYLYGFRLKDTDILLTIDKPPNKNKILNIQNKKDKQTFIDKYLVPDSQQVIYKSKYYQMDIDFNKVSQDYAGILFTGKRDYTKMHVLKYKGYDVLLSYFSASNYGCIWRTPIIDKLVLLAKYDIKSKKFIIT